MQILLDELKVAAKDADSYRWAVSTRGAAQLGGGYGMDEPWAAGVEKRARAGEAAGSQTPLAIARCKVEHGDGDGEWPIVHCAWWWHAHLGSAAWSAEFTRGVGGGLPRGVAAFAQVQ